MLRGVHRLAALIVLVVPCAAGAERVELNAVGDVSWPEIGFALDVVDAKGAGLFALAEPHVASGDLNFANLECPFTVRAPRAVKTYSYACDPKRLSYLVDAGFNLFSLANNHALDAGEEGAADTRAALAALSTPERPLFFAGTADTPDQAQLPVRFVIPGKSTRVAVFAVTNAPAGSGVGSLGSPELTDRIAAAARAADIVIVSVHNGPEYIHVATADTVARYHELIDAGAAVVLGHHPHVVQGIERYRRGVVFYSLGNFSFASHTLRHKETGARMYSMIGHVVFEDGAVREVTVVPLYVNNAEPWTVAGATLAPLDCTPQPLTGAFARAALAEFQDFGAALPGAAPTRIIVDGDIGRVEPSDRAIAVANPRAVKPLAKPAPARRHRPPHRR
jgi:poly-gamma-glutamate synthesis protein (capsule biosynthesis protein)